MESAQAKYIMNSDFATLKNDSEVTTVTLTIPASINIAAGATSTYSQDVTIGTVNAPMTVQISHSYSGTKYATNRLTFSATGIVSGLPYPYSYNTFVYRLNATTVRIIARIHNPTPDTLTTESTSRTVTSYIRTFLTPFN